MVSRFSWSPLGGLGEVGMNCMVFEFGDQIIPVDAGVVFADPNDYGVDAVYPDFRKLLTGGVKHWLITHGHEDHIGAVPALYYLAHQMGVPPPEVYAPPLAYALIHQKLGDEHYPGIQKYRDNLRKVHPGDSVTLGEVEAQFIGIRHSTPESCSLAMTWKDLKIYHTADFKLDFNEFEDGHISLKDFDVFKGASPDILFLDSTNAERTGQSVSETEIREHLETVIRTTPGRLFVTLFSSNVYRVALIIHLAEKHQRKVCLAGRSMRQTYQAARNLGLFDKCPAFSESSLIEPEESVHLDPKRVLVICSGSQGEFRSVLSKVASATHPLFQPTEDDTVLFSSKMIPGNERSILRLVDGLMRHNVRVLWGDRAEEEIGGPIHASGHGRSEELKEIIRFLKPRHLIPVHGALHQLKATESLAKEISQEIGQAIQTHVALNNSRLTFEQKGTWECVDFHFESIPKEKFLRFEYFDCPSRDPFLKARKFAADGGCVSVAVDSVGKVSLAFRGLVPENFSYSHSFSIEEIREEVLSWVNHKMLSLDRAQSLKTGDLDSIRHECEEELGKMLKKMTGSRPVVIFHFV